MKYAILLNMNILIKLKKNEIINMFIILNKNMALEIKNKDIYQFFGDATYRCIPPTFRGYRLYVISGYHLTLKRAIILAYILYKMKLT